MNSISSVIHSPRSAIPILSIRNRFVSHSPFCITHFPLHTTFILLLLFASFPPSKAQSHPSHKSPACHHDILPLSPTHSFPLFLSSNFPPSSIISFNYHNAIAVLIELTPITALPLQIKPRHTEHFAHHPLNNLFVSLGKTDSVSYTPRISLSRHG